MSRFLANTVATSDSIYKKENTGRRYLQYGFEIMLVALRPGLNLKAVLCVNLCNGTVKDDTDFYIL